MKKRFLASLIIIGFSGIVAQLLLLREFFVKFYGNELSLGIILANWLMLEAAGAFFLRKWIERIRQKIEAFVILQAIFALLLPLAVYLIRILNVVLRLAPGEGLGIVGIFWASFTLLFPICFSHGALFTFGCSIYSGLANNDIAEKERTAGRVYIYSTIGTLIGGIAFTYIFIRYLNSFHVAFIVCLLHIIASLILLGLFFSPKKPLMAKIIGYALFISLFINIFFILKTEEIHLDSLKRQWPNQNVAFYGNSVYGNVAVLEKDKQYAFLSNGTPIFTSPVPDIISVEEFAHIPLLWHPAPKDILIISAGAGGLINEILKHPVKKIDYCEIDPLIIKTAERFFTPLMKAELSDPRVKINYLDGRLFLKNTPDKYDIIIIGIQNPSDLQLNRLFTEEFFLMAKSKLQKGGIFTLTSIGSSSYLSDELRQLNACLYDTLIKNFDYAYVVAGDTNIILASDSKSVSAITPGLLSQRLKRRGIATSAITQRYLEYRLDAQWRKWYFDSIKNIKTRINKDFSPSAVFYSLSYWNAKFSPRTQKIFRYLDKINLPSLTLLIGVFTSLFLLAGKKAANIKSYGISYVIMTTGFCGIIFDLILLFAFQILYGFVYYWSGLLITAFMSGLAIGSLWMTFNLRHIRDEITAFIKFEIAIIIFAFSLPFILVNIYAFKQAAFLMLCMFCGFLVGAEFPLANKIYLKTNPSITQTAGFIYASDLLGGWVGGVLAAVAFIPVIGLAGTCVLLAILKASSLVVLIFTHTQKSKNGVLVG